MIQYLIIVDYLLVQYKLIIMCNKNILIVGFCWLLCEISLFLVYEVMCEFEMMIMIIEMLLQIMQVLMFEGKKLVLILILWVGNGLMDGIFEMILGVCVGFVGMYCDFEML